MKRKPQGTDKPIEVEEEWHDGAGVKIGGLVLAGGAGVGAGYLLFRPKKKNTDGLSGGGGGFNMGK